MAERGGVVEVIIRAKDLTASVVNRFRASWRRITNTVRDASRTLVAFTAAGAAAVLTLTKLDEQGNKVIAVKAAFARITGDEVRALNLLREASNGTIADLKLMELANQAITLGAAKTVEEFSEMVRVSRELGRAQGVDALSALESLTIGLARQSPRILDNIGLQVELGDTTTFAARAMEQARRKADELTGGMQVGAEAGAKFSAAFVNAKDAIAEFVARSPLVESFLNTLSDLTGGIVSAFSGDTERLKEGFTAIGSFAGNAFAAGFFQVLASSLNALERLILPKWLEDKIATPLGIFGGAAQENVDRALEAANAWLVVIRSFSRRPAASAVAGAGGGGGLGGGSLSIPDIAFRGAHYGLFPSTNFLRPGVREEVLANRRARLEAFGHQGRLRPLTKTPKEAANELDQAGQVAVAAFGSMAEAAIAGSDQVARSVVNMITEILRSLPGVGGLAGSVIGAVGGIFGAFLGRRDREVPVRVSSYDSRALSQMKETTGPLRVTTIIEQGGVEIERIERNLISRQNRDEVVRYGRRGHALTG